MNQRDYSNSIARCADRNGISYSYFASTQPAWDWIYETIEGKPLLLKSKMNHKLQNGCGNKAVFVLEFEIWEILLVQSVKQYKTISFSS